MASVAISSLAFGTLGVITTLAYRQGVTPLPLLTWRFFFAALILGTMALQRNPRALSVPASDLVRYFALSVLGFGAASLAYFLALKHADAAIITALLYAYPAFVTIGASLFYRENVPSSRWLAIAVIFIGCVLILNVFGGSGQVDAIGAALGLTAAVAYAAFNLMSQRWLPGRSSMTMMSFTFGFSALAFAVLTLATTGLDGLLEWRDWTPGAWSYMGLLVVLPTITASLLYLRGVRQLGASRSGIISTLEPLFTVALAWMLLGEQLAPVQLIGVILIVGGVATTTILSKEAEPTPALPLAPDELLERRADWVGPDGEPAPDYVLAEIARQGSEEATDAGLADDGDGNNGGCEGGGDVGEDDPSEDPGPCIEEPCTPAQRAVSARMRRRRRIVIAAFGGIMTVIVVQVAVMAAFVWWLGTPLPDITARNIESRSSLTSTIYAADGTVLATWTGDENREVVSTDAIPDTIKNATVAIEDRRFWDHSGVDLRGIIRALKRNYDAGVVKQGGSTITQQLMKMLYTGDEQSIQRKVNEALKATRVELGYDKDQILTSYLNMAYFGSGAYGIQSASEKFYGKKVGELTLVEAATLAGMLRSPSSYDPFDDPGPVVARRNVVLSAMHQEGMITEDQYREACEAELDLVEPTADPTVVYPYFVDSVRRELVAKLGQEVVDRGGLEVYTTLDPAVQQAAEAAAATFSAPTEPEVALVSVRPTDGAVVAMVGGRSWATSEFNLATQGKRQPGSAFKPFVLCAALENGFSLANKYSASPFTTKVKNEDWNVNNYSDSRSTAVMNLSQATVWSVNTVFARLIMDVGPAKVVSVAHAMGITSQLDPDPAIALGGLTYGVTPLEMASAFGTISNGGQHVEPTCISVVVNHDGEQILAISPKPVQAISKQTADTVASVLHEAVVSGTGAAANIGGTAGKTGTTQSHRDAWFVGWGSGVSTAVWVGYPQAQIEMTNVRGRAVTGGSFPAEIWASYMSAARSARPTAGFVIPDNLAVPVPESTEETPPAN